MVVTILVGVPLTSVLMVLVMASTVVPTLAELHSSQVMLDVVDASTDVLDGEVVASTDVLFQSSQLIVLLTEAEEVVEAATEVGVVLVDVVASTEVELPQSSHDIVELDEVVSAKTLELETGVVLDAASTEELELETRVVLDVASTEELEREGHVQVSDEEELEETASTDEVEAVVVDELRASTEELLAAVEGQSDHVALARRWNFS